MNKVILENREIPLDIKNLDKKKILELENFFKKNPKIFNSLDIWIILPDKCLKGDLLKLKDFVNNLYKEFKCIDLYRGFDIGFAVVGENLNFKSTSKIGDAHDFNISKDKAISFSSDISVARTFGEYVVKIRVCDFSNILIITDELSYLVAKSRNLKPVTQKEYILFGEQLITPRIIEKNKRSWGTKILGW